MKFIAGCALLFLLSACGNPGGISDSDYAEYKEYGAPKILFSCTVPRGLTRDDLIPCERKDGTDNQACLSRVHEEAKKPVAHVSFKAGIGRFATYNKILGDAKSECEGVFKILDSRP